MTDCPLICHRSHAYDSRITILAAFNITRLLAGRRLVIIATEGYTGYAMQGIFTPEEAMTLNIQRVRSTGSNLNMAPNCYLLDGMCAERRTRGEEIGHCRRRRCAGVYFWMKTVTKLYTAAHRSLMILSSVDSLVMSKGMHCRCM